MEEESIQGRTYWSAPSIQKNFKPFTPLEIPTLFKIQQTACFQVIKEAVCGYYNLDFKEFHSRKRTHKLVLVKQMFCYLMITYFKDNTSISLKTIGAQIYYNELAGKQYDHTSVLHGKNTIKNLLATGEVSKETIGTLLIVINKKLTTIWQLSQ